MYYYADINSGLTMTETYIVDYVHRDKSKNIFMSTLLENELTLRGMKPNKTFLVNQVLLKFHLAVEKSVNNLNTNINLTLPKVDTLYSLN